MNEGSYPQRFKEIANKYYELLVKYESSPKPIDFDKVELDNELMDLEDTLSDLMAYRSHEVFEQMEADIKDKTDLLGKVIDDLERGKL